MINNKDNEEDTNNYYEKYGDKNDLTRK